MPWVISRSSEYLVLLFFLHVMLVMLVMLVLRSYKLSLILCAHARTIARSQVHWESIRGSSFAQTLTHLTLMCLEALLCTKKAIAASYRHTLDRLIDAGKIVGPPPP